MRLRGTCRTCFGSRTAGLFPLWRRGLILGTLERRRLLRRGAWAFRYRRPGRLAIGQRPDLF